MMKNKNLPTLFGSSLLAAGAAASALVLGLQAPASALTFTLNTVYNGGTPRVIQAIAGWGKAIE